MICGDFTADMTKDGETFSKALPGRGLAPHRMVMVAKPGSAIIGNGLIVIGNDPDPASSHHITDSQLVTERCHEHVTRDSLLWDYATLLLIHSDSRQ